MGIYTYRCAEPDEMRACFAEFYTAEDLAQDPPPYPAARRPCVPAVLHVHSARFAARHVLLEFAGTEYAKQRGPFFSLYTFGCTRYP